MITLLSIFNGKAKNKFEEIYDSYSGYLYAIGLKILKDEELASDAVLQCYFKIYKNIDKVRDMDPKQTRSFFGITMCNEAIMIHNKYLAVLDGADDNFPEYAAEAAEDELICKFDQWEKENPDICVPKDAKLKILDMADNFNKLQSREENRKRLKKYALEAAGISIAVTAILKYVF